MCEYGKTRLLEVTIPAKLSCTGSSRTAFKPVDECIADYVEALNKAGLKTVASCCGHGKYSPVIEMENGDKLTIERG